MPSTVTIERILKVECELASIRKRLDQEESTSGALLGELNALFLVSQSFLDYVIICSKDLRDSHMVDKMKESIAKARARLLAEGIGT